LRIFVAVPPSASSEAAVGYVSFQRMDAEEGRVGSLAVTLSHRRNGVGELLMQAAIAECAAMSLRRVTLHVSATGHNASSSIRLYTRLRFSPVHWKTAYYNGSEDAMFMVLSLK